MVVTLVICHPIIQTFNFPTLHIVLGIGERKMNRNSSVLRDSKTTMGQLFGMVYLTINFSSVNFTFFSFITMARHRIANSRHWLIGAGEKPNPRICIQVVKALYRGFTL